ncbi:hypothetical protein [Acidovorax sp. MR-S7]|uniref:hypothetical protein n=1 Tax=Acidovorax sp. MR-S7 TaxID=1268622 RepID=UPI00035C3834|nr:hypothetical protein [Acidovorax sp. MR-S7]GAD20904.1 hypothetical protein AVS7_00665 [Acidovorax sp. MR-S7]
MADADHKRMLEMAAKAAGFDWVDFSGDMNPSLGFPANCQRGYWHPLADDGDALRLAAALRIDLEWNEQRGFRTVEAYRRTDGPHFCATEAEASYRRAIVRAAAAIGEQMP